MVEIFNYTERVVNMIRPRKLLFMAIGVFLLSSGIFILTFFYPATTRWCGTSCQNEPTTLQTF